MASLINSRSEMDGSVGTVCPLGFVGGAVSYAGGSVGGAVGGSVGGVVGGSVGRSVSEIT